MPIYRLSEDQIEEFDELSEVTMDIHMARLGGRTCAIVGGRVAAVIDEEAIAQSRELNLFSEEPGPSSSPELTFENWIERLEEAPRITPLRGQVAQDALLAMRIKPRPAATAFPPKPPASVYGHLPFAAQVSVSKSFYRFEAFPSSRRLVGMTIAPDTFAVPSSERPFIPSGFAAVARYALPSLFPAIFVHKIDPDLGTKFYCGACVPMYGQSGGGVEVCFFNGGTNKKAFASPSKISPL